MHDWTQSALSSQGFEGFLTAAELRSTALAEVPAAPGVYCVLRSANDAPTFSDVSSAGRFKGRNPSLTRDRLHSKWVNGVAVIYVGKAGGGNSREHLKRRLGTYLRFGEGVACAHWGGRAIWQLADARMLLFAWRVTENDDAAEVERSMLTTFKRQFQALPFANMRR